MENRFEFVVIAGARARQLIRGAVPRVVANQKPVMVAQREVRTGAVKKIEPGDIQPDAAATPPPEA